MSRFPAHGAGAAKIQSPLSKVHLRSAFASGSSRKILPAMVTSGRIISKSVPLQGSGKFDGAVDR